MADKYLEWNDTDQLEVEVEVITTSSGAGDSGKLIGLNSSGEIDPSMLPAADVKTLTAGENLSAGDFIYIDAAGEALKADASVGNKRAMGYVKTAITASSTGPVYFEGINSGLGGLTAGDEYFLSDTVAGDVTNTAPTTSGSIVQSVGFAISATEIVFEHSTRPLKRA